MTGSPPIVIDASIAAAIVLGEPDGPASAAAIAEWTRSGVRTVVPAHFWLEVTNSLVARRRMLGSQVLEAIHNLDQLRFETIELDRAGLLLTIDISERHRLTAYDAAYLALAISLDALLLTFDADLRAAAGSRAVRVGPARLSEGPAPYRHEVTWPNYKGASAFLSKLRAEAARPG